MKNEPSPINTQIYEEASEWFVECRSGELDADTRRKFASWLRTSPEHMRAYLELAAIWNEGPRLDSMREFDGLDAAEDTARSNVIPLERGQTRSGSDHSSLNSNSIGRLPSRWSLAAPWRAVAASVAVVALLGGATYLYSQRNTYSTGTGEQRAFTLPDGSVIQLNARSRVRVDYRDAERDITLVQGQALFKVARDATRPFVVIADQTRVRAVGTQFDVYRRQTGTTVTVVEGRVAVVTAESDYQPASTPDPHVELQKGEILLGAGEQATVTAHETQQTASPNIEAATAWTQQRLVFESTSLEDVAMEFNRYNARPLIIEGNPLAHLRITGTFSSADPASIIRFLRARPGITVSEGTDRIVVAAENSSAR